MTSRSCPPVKCRKMETNHIISILISAVEERHSMWSSEETSLARPERVGQREDRTEVSGQKRQRAAKAGNTPSRSGDTAREVDASLPGMLCEKGFVWCPVAWGA